MLDAGLLSPNPRPPGADPQTAQAIRRLRVALVHCEIEPGHFVAEQGIAERFGLGRAAVRVALTALEGTGLVIRRPRQGWQAAPITGELIDAIYGGRARLEAALAVGRLKPSERSRLDQLTGIVTALHGRSDGAVAMTVRAADRQLRDALAARTDELTRRWLSQVWDHRDRVVHVAGRGGVAVKAPDRRPLIAALARGDVKAASAWLRRDVLRERKLITTALARSEILNAAPPTRSARRRRERPVHPTVREETYQRQE
jgi:DNA-binding GntR family transcriptional regulator